MEIRHIVWVDSMGMGGWEPLEKFRKLRPMEMQTVGWVIEEGEDFVTILQSYDERVEGEPQGDNAISIPRAAIRASRTAGFIR